MQIWHLTTISAGCSFQVNEQPGTYFWHGHSSAEQIDGLSGPLIVKSPVPEPWQYDEEKVLMLRDWWHSGAEALSMNLNRWAPSWR